MATPTDTSVIQRLIGQTRRRIRLQWALEGAVTATIAAAALALVSVVAVRRAWIQPNIGIALLVLAGVVIVGGAMYKGARSLDAERVARCIDRASNLSDRLSTAIAFHGVLAGTMRSGTPAPEGAVSPEQQTEEMMQLAIKDGVRAAARANIRAAAPFATPKDLPAACGFLAISALVAGLALPATIERHPHVVAVTPDHIAAGHIVTITGTDLLAGMQRPISAKDPYIPPDGSIAIGTLAKSQPVKIMDWTENQITVEVPRDATIGEQQLLVFRP